MKDDDGTVSSSERLILDHLPLVDAITRRYAGRGEPLDDLVQVGSIGLVKSAHHFDPDRGVAFASCVPAHQTLPWQDARSTGGLDDDGWAVGGAASRLT